MWLEQMKRRIGQVQRFKGHTDWQGMVGNLKDVPFTLNKTRSHIGLM